ncbi:hypothetical protein C3L33_03537, partial [Rhododendron williamsianum]
MLTCIARSKHPGDDSLNQDPNATPTTKQSLKSLTYQIKDMAWKASGAYRNCTPCTGAMTTQHRQKSCRGGEPNLALDQRFRWSHRRTASLNSASTAGSRQWGKEMEERLKGMSSGEGTPAASASGRRVDPVVFVEEHEPKEWVAQVDSGVLITFVSMPRGGNDLKRIRFSREKYNKWQAQRWWTENYDRVMELYNVQRLNRQAFPLPPTPPRSEAESVKTRPAEDNTPATPPLRNEHHPVQSRYNYDSGLTSTPEISSISGAKTETSSVDASLRTSSSREADRSGEISVSNGSGLETEWVEEDEPGVYITIRALPGRKRELRRVRFRLVLVVSTLGPNASTLVVLHACVRGACGLIPTVHNNNINLSIIMKNLHLTLFLFGQLILQFSCLVLKWVSLFVVHGCGVRAVEKSMGRCMLDCGGKRIEPGYINNTCDEFPRN